MPERRVTPPAKRKSDLAPSLKGSLPSLLSRFAGGEAARDARASSAWAVVATLRETFYVPADPSLSQTVKPTDLVRACVPELLEVSLVQRVTGRLEICRGSL